MRKDRFIGWHLVLLHLASLLFGGTALFSKLLPMDAINIILFRGLFSCVVLILILVIFSPEKLKISPVKDRFYVLFSGMCFGVHLWAYFYAIQVSSVGIGVISLFTFPMITTLVEPILLKSKPKAKDVLLGLVVLLGVFFIVSDSKFKSNEIAGVGLGLISAFTYSIRNLIQKYRLSTYSPLPILFYQLLITLFLMLPFSTIQFSEISAKNYGYLVLLSIVFTIVPHLAVIESLKKFDARSVGLILTLQVFYAILFAFILFHEKLSISVLSGAVLVIFAVGFETIRMKIQSNK